MNDILTRETFSLLETMQKNLEAVPCSEILCYFPPDCDDCSGGSCSGGCSYTSD